MNGAKFSQRLYLAYLAILICLFLAGCGEGVSSLISGTPTPSPTRTLSPKLVVIVHSIGERCADAPVFTDVKAALASLTAEGIYPFGHDKVVDEAAECVECGCPEPIYYRVNIGEDDLEHALSLGWTLQDELAGE